MPRLIMNDDIILVTKTQFEGTSPQVDNRGGVDDVDVRGNLEAVRVRAREASVRGSNPRAAR